MKKQTKVIAIASLLLSAAVAIKAAPQLVAEDDILYSCDFNGSFSSLGYSVIDANNDGVTWTETTTSSTFRVLNGETIPAVSCYSASVANSNMDDWLVTPSFKLEAGKTYKTTFTFSKLMYAAMPDVVEIKMGTKKTAAAMSIPVLGPQTLPQFPGNTLWSFTAEISVETAGNYYIGIHAIGQNVGKFGIAGLKMEKGISVTTPAAVTNLTVTPDATGDKNAVISFTAPQADKTGAPLTALSRIEIRRNDRLIGVLGPEPNTDQVMDIEPGGTYSYLDNTVVVNGIYTYSVVACNATGAGDAATATAFVGINTPASARNVEVVSAGNASTLVKWSAPVVDKDGYPISSQLLSYDVMRAPLYSSERQLIAEDVVECQFFDNNAGIADSVQRFYQYSVIAKTVEGNADAVVSEPVPMGKPFEMPYKESMARGRYETMFTSVAVRGNNYWQVSTDFEDVASEDGDNGFVYLNGQIGGAAALLSGLVDLSGFDSPTLNYYTYNLTGCDPADNTLKIEITSSDGSEKIVDEYVPAMGWNKTIVRLDEFVGKTIRMRFIGSRNNNTELFLDNIALSNIYRQDLKANGITAPAEVKSDEAYTVTVDVLNFGSDVSGNYQVQLFADGVKVASHDGESLAVGAHDHVTFERCESIVSGDSIEYSAKVVYEQDMNGDNNETAVIAVKVRKPSYPTVSDLTGAYQNGTVSLSWGEPDTSKAQPYEITDDFESYDSWATTNVGGWVFVDCDKAQIAGFTEQVMPGIPAYSQQSWWVFDGSDENFRNGSFATLSGYKFLASMISGIKGEGTVQNDDWAISPELFGGAQTITINARSYSMISTELETFEVLYSTGSLQPEDFVSLKKFENISNEWTAFDVELPDGAKRFAIRNISNAKYVLMVDDVTFIPAGDAAAFTINGYNVYRDGVKINAEPIEENEFVDADAGNGNHTYMVTVVYAAGESLFSNAFNPIDSSVAELGVKNITVVSAAGEIIIYGGSECVEVAVCALDGRVIVSQACDAELHLPVASGFYIVHAGNTVAKVHVR